MNNLTPRGMGTVLVLLSTLALVGAVRADTPPGYVPDFPGATQVIAQIYDVATQSLKNAQNAFSDPAFLQKVANGAWSAARATTNDEIKAALGTPGAALPGQTFYNIVVSMAASGKVSAWPENNGIGLGIYLANNYIEATSTQPTPAGKWADPRFSVNFDTEVICHLEIPTDATALTAAVVAVSIHNAKLDSHGIVADLAFMVSDLIKFFSGADFVAMVESRINQTQRTFPLQLNNGLAPVNRVIQQLAQQGFGALSSSLNPGSRTLALMLTKSNVRTSGPGVITGVVSWPRSYGYPQYARPASPGAGGVSDAGVGRMLMVTARVQFLPPGQMSFTGPTLPVGRVEVHQMPGTADQYQVQYRITDLPTDEPIMVDVSDAHNYAQWAPGTDPSASWESRLFRQSGWSGNVTVLPTLMSTYLGTAAQKRAVAGAVLSAAGPSSDEVALNPQPLPPRAVRSGVATRLNRAALNPQPLPPKTPTVTVARAAGAAGAIIRGAGADPRAQGTVSGVDWTMTLVEPPR